ncbi:hypothetical protein BKA65DRAFT_549585 [Rhexocercosporidium sp. MPI-PUGE-AT-0058]|nr:hypothetical protein BKA65DRAFT_549585 [Rhexocercosporidium sp. MPI-PUGE-AT-0058]
MLIKDPATGVEYVMMGENDDPFWFEREVLPVWYACMLLLGLTLPLVYLAISRSARYALSLKQPTRTSVQEPSILTPASQISSSSPTTSIPSPEFGLGDTTTRNASTTASNLSPTQTVEGSPWILTLLSLTTAFADLCSFTEPYNLARPVDVCFYPVRAERFHHPEEKRLRVQWMCFLGAAGLAGVVGGWELIGLGKGLLDREGGLDEDGDGEDGERRREWWMFPRRGYVDLLEEVGGGGGFDVGVDMDEKIAEKMDEDEGGINVHTSPMSLGAEEEAGEEVEEERESEEEREAEEGREAEGEVEVGVIRRNEMEEQEEEVESNDSQPSLLTPTASEHGTSENAAIINDDDDTDRDHKAQEVVVRRNRTLAIWTYLRTLPIGLSREHLMGLAWLLTFAAWLVMYGHSKKARFFY